MIPRIINWRSIQTKNRFHLEDVTDITRRNYERNRTTEQTNILYIYNVILFNKTYSRMYDGYEHFECKNNLVKS